MAQDQDPQYQPNERPVVYYAEPPTAYDDEIDLMEIVSALWAGKWTIVASTILAACIGVAIALWLPNLYRADALLASASREEQSMVAGLAQQFGGLAGLTGMRLPQSETDQLTLAIATLESRSFLSAFVKRHELEVPLIAATGWDDENQRWILDEGAYDTASGTWVREVRNRESPGPTDWELYEAISGRLTVDRDLKTGLVTVALELLSPLAAKQWVDWLIQDVNDRMRHEEIAEAEESIRYLQEQAESTALAEMRNVFFRLIEQQTQRRMLAEVRTEFIFETVDPAVVPEEKASPQRAIIAILAVLLGGFLGMVVVLIRNSMRKRAETATR